MGSPGAPFRSSLGALRARLDVRGPLFAAQAALIRVCVLFWFFCEQIGRSSFLRRLHTYAPSVVLGRCDGLSLLRRLRISVCVTVFLYVCYCLPILFNIRGDGYFLRRLRTYTRPPGLSGTVAASLFCAGCADMRAVLFHTILSVWRGADVMRKLRVSAPSPWLSWCRPGVWVKKKPLFV